MSPITELFAPNIALPLASITELCLTFDLAYLHKDSDYQRVDKMSESYENDGYTIIESHYYPVYMNILNKRNQYILVTYAYNQVWDIVIQENEISTIRDRINIILLEKKLIYTLQPFLDKGYIIKQSATAFERSFVFDLIHQTQPSYSLSLVSVTKRKASLIITKK